jgi:hypothetical protein
MKMVQGTALGEGTAIHPEACETEPRGTAPGLRDGAHHDPIGRFVPLVRCHENDPIASRRQGATGLHEQAIVIRWMHRQVHDLCPVMDRSSPVVAQQSGEVVEAIKESLRPGQVMRAYVFRTRPLPAGYRQHQEAAGTEQKSNRLNRLGRISK